MTLEFTVYGVAQQAGSKRAFVPKGWSRPVITDANRNLKAWQLLVAEAAHHAIGALPSAGRQLLEAGVTLTVAFYLPRPKTMPRKRTAHVTAPDLDKIVRGLGDALTGVVYRDDAQIVDLIAMKRYAAGHEVPHVDIRVGPSEGLGPVTIAPLPLFAEEDRV